MIRIEANRLREPAAWIMFAVAVTQILVAIWSMLFGAEVLGFAARAALSFSTLVSPVQTALLVGAVVLVTRLGAPTPRARLIGQAAFGGLALTAVAGVVGFFGGFFGGDVLAHLLTGLPLLALTGVALLYLAPQAIPEKRVIASHQMPPQQQPYAQSSYLPADQALYQPPPPQQPPSVPALQPQAQEQQYASQPQQEQYAPQPQPQQEQQQYASQPQAQEQQQYAPQPQAQEQQYPPQPQEQSYAPQVHEQPSYAPQPQQEQQPYAPQQPSYPAPVPQEQYGGQYAASHAYPQAPQPAYPQQTPEQSYPQPAYPPPAEQPQSAFPDFPQEGAPSVTPFPHSAESQAGYGGYQPQHQVPQQPQPFTGYSGAEYARHSYEDPAPVDPRGQQLAHAYQQAEVYQQSQAGMQYTPPSRPYDDPFGHPQTPPASYPGQQHYGQQEQPGETTAAIEAYRPDRDSADPIDPTAIYTPGEQRK